MQSIPKIMDGFASWCMGSQRLGVTKVRHAISQHVPSCHREYMGVVHPLLDRVINVNIRKLQGTEKGESWRNVAWSGSGQTLKIKLRV